MDSRIDFVEATIDFRFQDGFRSKFLELGEPVDVLELWYRNAQVFVEMLRVYALPQEVRSDLLTLIETIRIHAQTLYPPVKGIEDLLFETSSYQFPKDIESCKAQVISLVLAQEGANLSGEAKN
jgi:hypothetical protein